MRKSSSESTLELSSSGDMDTIPAFTGTSSYGQGNKRQALALDALEPKAVPSRSAEWLRQNRKGSISWQNNFLSNAAQSPATQWEFPSSSDSDSQALSSGSTATRLSEEGERNCRQSLESTSSKEEAESMANAGQYGTRSRADILNRCFNGTLGISERKSLLNSLSEQEADVKLGPCTSSFGNSYPSRSCLSLGDSASAVAWVRKPSLSETEETGPEVSQELQRTSLGSRSSSSGYLCEGQAAAELFLRLNHARQTVSFVRNQASRFSVLDRAHMTIWEALERLGSMREYETALMEHPDTDPGMPLLEHAFQTAEACRIAFPHDDWLHLVGLLHSLGKLLGHASIAGEPQWAICGESFPVGCRFDPGVGFSQFFSVNPDRRCRGYNTPTGIYRQGGGLASVYMSWSASEYLYMLLLLNRTLLPPQALFIIRYQKFLSLETSSAYRSLMCKADQRYLPWLGRFRALSAYKRTANVDSHLTGDAFRSYYDGLMKKYIPAMKLRF